jgi:hypothetical protein
METSNVPSGQSEGKRKRRGIYFLANDRVYELTVAFLNSLRLSNPKIEACLIPYDSASERIKGLCVTYNFSILDDEDTFRWCDNISVLFHDHVRGHYRKLAAWAGPFDEFIYVDVDTVVLASVDICFALLTDYDFVSAHSNSEGSRRMVWKDTIFQSGFLNDNQINFAANTGFLTSKQAALDRRAVTAAVKKAAKLSSHMELLCFEQPLLNYLIVSSGRPYTSLHVLHYQRGLEVPLEIWAGEPGGAVEGGKIRFENRPEPLFVHWAGVHNAGEWHSKTPGPEMPYRSLWDYYRKLRKEI